MRELLLDVGGFALTVALHACVLVAVAVVLEAVVRRASLGAREVLWRVALLAAPVTATVQSAVGIDPLAGSWRALPTEPTSPAATESEPAALAPLAAPARATAPPLPWREAIVAAWLAGASVAVLHLAVALWLLHRRLAPRTVAPELLGPAREVATALGMSRTPRLTTSPHAATPLALGLWRREVCVPEHALRELGAAELRALLAHELAHVARRDPAWILVYAVLCRAFFCHPALLFARRRLLTLAEQQCDARARATHPGAGVALARTLLCAARWLAQAPRGLRHAHGHAMAATASGLRARVHLLLAPPAPPSLLRSRLLCAGAFGACGAAPLVLPDVRAAELAPASVSSVADAQPAAAASALDDVPADLRDSAFESTVPLPLRALARDIALVRREVDELRVALAESTVADADAVRALFAAIDVRLLLLESRCAQAIARHRILVPDSSR